MAGVAADCVGDGARLSSCSLALRRGACSLSIVATVDERWMKAGEPVDNLVAPEADR